MKIMMERGESRIENIKDRCADEAGEMSTVLIPYSDIGESVMEVRLYRQPGKTREKGDGNAKKSCFGEASCIH